MKSILNIFKLSFLTITLLLTVGCSDDNSSALRLNEDTAIKSFALDNYSGTIDQQKETITITLPEDYDMAAMTVTDIQLPVGAEATLKRGDVLNLNMTQTIKVSNGNVFQQYVIKTRYDEARILTFQLNDMYSGIIDQQNQNILVQVPASADITKLVPTYTATEGAIVAPAGRNRHGFQPPGRLHRVQQYGISCLYRKSTHTHRQTGSYLCRSRFHYRGTEPRRERSSNVDAVQCERCTVCFFQRHSDW